MRSFQLVFSTKRERTSALDWLLLSANNDASHVKYLSRNSSDLLSLMEYVWADSKAFTFRMAHSKGQGMFTFFQKADPYTNYILCERKGIINGFSAVCRPQYILCTCFLDIGLKIDQLSHSNLHGVFLKEKTVFFLKLNYKIWWHLC